MSNLYFAVIGNPIDHSLSPLIHSYFAQQTQLSVSYEKIKGEDRNFKQQVLNFFQHGGFGLNVTLPFKQQAFTLANETSVRCQKAGAANTLWMQKKKLYADNTDGIGLIRDLTHHMDLSEQSILVLGAGGATRGIIDPLMEMKPACLTVANRTLDKALSLLQAFPLIKVMKLTELHGCFDLIINATSSSLSGEAILLPEDIMAQKPFCYDLAYDQHKETTFVKYARRHSCPALDGLGMLVEQAAEAFYLWNGVRPLTYPVLQQLRTA